MLFPEKRFAARLGRAQYTIRKLSLSTNGGCIFIRYHVCLNRLADSQTDRQTDGLTVRETGRQADRRRPSPHPTPHTSLPSHTSPPLLSSPLLSRLLLFPLPLFVLCRLLSPPSPSFMCSLYWRLFMLDRKSTGLYYSHL